MILLKMGGSVITDKSVPLSFRRDAVVSLAGAVSKVAESEPVILVHGGGSFGHHYSVIHDMHTEPARYDLKGFCTVRNSMVHLHHLVLDALHDGGVLPYSCPPSILVHSSDVPYTEPAAPGGMARERVLETYTIASSGLCPVVYGDAMWCGNGTSHILSGDAIMTMLAKLLDVRLAIFATDVDGLYTGPDLERLIRRADAKTAYAMAGSGRGAAPTRSDGGSDVTGGMARKVRAAGDICRMGTDVFFVNGNKPHRISDITRSIYDGTLFAAKPRGVEA